MSTPPPTVWPVRRCKDARAVIDMLVDAFGFQSTAVHLDGDLVAHAELRWPLGGGVMLGSAREETDWPQQPGRFGAYVVTDDVDSLHERAVAAGAEVVYPPRDTDYGSREAAYRDPEGGLWSFGTYRGADG